MTVGACLCHGIRSKRCLIVLTSIVTHPFLLVKYFFLVVYVKSNFSCISPLSLSVGLLLHLQLLAQCSFFDILEIT